MPRRELSKPQQIIDWLVEWGDALKEPAAMTLVGSAGLLWHASRLGLDAAKRLFLTAERLEAEELFRIGFLTELVGPQELMPRVDTLAATLAANAPLAVQGMKRALNAIARGDADFAEIAATAGSVRLSADLKEGQRAWAEKRLPRFEGR